MKKVKAYAEDSLMNLFDVIDRWNDEHVQSVCISLTDLTLMKNHIEDLELEEYALQDIEHQDVKPSSTIPKGKVYEIIYSTMNKLESINDDIQSMRDELYQFLDIHYNFKTFKPDHTT